MVHLGTYPAGSDWTWDLTLQDEDGSAVDLKVPSTATVVGYVERNGAVYLDGDSITLNADADGNPPQASISAANSGGFPEGRFTFWVQSTQGAVVRQWRHTLDVVRLK